MSLKSECETSVFSFAPLYKQLNANLFDEHVEYVRTVIKMHRDEYLRRKLAGETTFVLSDADKKFLGENTPW
mgnify:FL=1